MISRKHKTIFIHIHKNAGSSIENKLGHFDQLKAGVQDHRKIRDYEKMISGNERLYALKYSLYHLKNGQLRSGFNNLIHLISPELTSQEYASFFKFTFVRNSWDRIYSWYMNAMREDYQKKKLNLSEDTSLKDFIRYKLNYQTFNQLSYMTNSKGEIPLDFIGRFENLETDFRHVCNELGISNDVLPKLLISGNNHYTDYYDTETKDLVYKLYKEEIEKFQFNFGE